MDGYVLKTGFAVESFKHSRKRRVRTSRVRPAVSAQTLRASHFAHVHNVPFENLDIHLGKPLSLEPADLFSKIVTHKRGSLLLRSQQFLYNDFARLRLPSGRACWPGCSIAFPISARAAISSCWLPWIMNLGSPMLGSAVCCLREPLRLTQGVVYEQGPDSFRLRAEPGPTYILEAFLTGRWQDLYVFTLEPFELVDYEPFNYWNSTSPHVRWTQQKVCTIPTKDGRIVAVDREFKIHTRGNTQTMLAKSHEEYLQLLHNYFGLEITGAFIK